MSFSGKKGEGEETYRSHEEAKHAAESEAHHARDDRLAGTGLHHLLHLYFGARKHVSARFIQLVALNAPDSSSFPLAVLVIAPPSSSVPFRTPIPRLLTAAFPQADIHLILLSHASPMLPGVEERSTRTLCAIILACSSSALSPPPNRFDNGPFILSLFFSAVVV